MPTLLLHVKPLMQLLVAVGRLAVHDYAVECPYGTVALSVNDGDLCKE